MLRRQASITSGLILITISLVARATGPTLHEFVAPDPREDVAMGNTTISGGFPASVETPSGLVAAPDTLRAPRGDDHAYARTSPTQGSTFAPDRDTRKPPAVSYDDPFSPAVTPFKRLNAFDAVRQDETFRVADPTPRLVRPSGASAASNEETFYADITVDLAAGEHVKIPSVAPGSRLLRMHTVPETAVELYTDSAENWTALSQVRTRVRLLLFLAAPRDAFGGPFRAATWAALPRVPALPRNVQAVADQVNKTIGVSREMSVREAVEKLVAYYRSFTDGDPPPAGADVFLDLALAKRGVCRHRAFAFGISALGLGIPTRLVTNEAHAWVEVHDGVLWRRIDLGGAAVSINMNDEDRTRVAHAPPPDVFGWPAGASPGQAMADQARNQGGGANDNNGSSSASGPSASSTAAGSTSAGPIGISSAASMTGTGPAKPGPGSSDRTDDRPLSTVVLRSEDGSLQRNQELHVDGHVEVKGASDRCGAMRVDLSLKGDRGEFSLGTLSSDDQGFFVGVVSIPSTVPVGNYDVVAVASGNQTCGPGRSE